MFWNGVFLSNSPVLLRNVKVSWAIFRMSNCLYLRWCKQIWRRMWPKFQKCVHEGSLSCIWSILVCGKKSLRNVFGKTKCWTKRSKYDQNMNHENSWTISDILKQVRESTDRDWTFIGEGEILERIGIVVTKFRFFANFLTHFLSKKRLKKWWKNGPFFDSVLVQKLDQFRVPFSLLFWFFWQTETSELYEVWLRSQTRFDFCKAWLEIQGRIKKWSKFKLNPKSYSGVYYIFKIFFFRFHFLLVFF